jgi:hypothetical protein
MMGLILGIVEFGSVSGKPTLAHGHNFGTSFRRYTVQQGSTTRKKMKNKRTKKGTLHNKYKLWKFDLHRAHRLDSQ